MVTIYHNISTYIAFIFLIKLPGIHVIKYRYVAMSYDHMYTFSDTLSHLFHIMLYTSHE